MTRERAWIGFWILAVVWGSSFLFIRIGVEQLTTFQVVFVRTGMAAVGLSLVARLQGKAFPRDWARLRDVTFLGIVNTVFPFALITWGEKSIESGLAAVLQATAALFTMIVAHFVFPDERITPKKVVGLVVGFIGVVVLASRSADGEVVAAEGHAHLLGQLAVVLACLCYAIGAAYGRKAIQDRLDPIIAAAGAMTITAVITGLIAYGAPLVGGPAPAPFFQLPPRILFSMVALGVINTFVAYLIFYSIIQTLGAARMAMVTYVIPVVGLSLGAVFLHEQVDARLLLGTILIMGSIGIVNLKLTELFRRAAGGARMQ